jgi:pimeloyl-ACP methyl ester carboxylesterase
MADRGFLAPRKRSNSGSPLSSGLRGLAALPLAAAAGWIIYSDLVIDHKVVLPEAIPSERKPYESRAAGVLSYYWNRGEAGRPLVLIHSINAAASAYEMRPLFMRYRSQRPVYALDLPGFGFSERSKRLYSPGLYVAAILDFLETQVKEPADVVALSLSSEFAARAALDRPELFNSLTIISPTGFSQRQNERGSQRASQRGIGHMLHALFAFPIWARPFYDLIATRSSIEFFLKQSFIGPLPQDLVDYDYAASHQPGAENAPLYFISGMLFTPTICQSVYERLQIPTLVIYDRDNFTSFEMLPDLLARNNAWQAVRLVPTLGLPQFERLNDTAEVLDRFWK